MAGSTLFSMSIFAEERGAQIGLVRIPNLTGRWRGYLITSFDGQPKRHDLMIHIFQSWTQIVIYLTTATSCHAVARQ